ncbi:30527_t:CDS:1, partial [Racocetra persica]
DSLYLFIDEFQYIFTDSTLCNVSKQFFQRIASTKLYYIAVGTFILVNLMTSSQNLILPFSKAKFEKMLLFNTNEMGGLFELYKLGINVNGVPYDLQLEIERESCEHPTSFISLLRLFNDKLPTIGQ